MRKKIAIIVGTRPEAIKLIPIYKQCIKSRIYQPIFISTGQHGEVLDQILDYFNVRPEYNLSVLEEESNLSKLTGRLFRSIETAVAESIPDIIVVQGDTCSAWVSAMVGFYNKIPVAHVEAGLRTWNKFSPFPEELYRTQISRIADIHFSPTVSATNNLKKEGISNIHMVGNTVVDSLFACLDRERSNPSDISLPTETDLISGKIVLITCHRRENFTRLAEIAKAVNTLSVQHPELVFILPLHMNPIVQKEFGSKLNISSNILLQDPIPYNQFVVLLSKSHMVLTDSGGVQEEAASCHIPFLILREVTERNEAVVSGCAEMAGTTAKSIVDIFNSIHNNSGKYQNMKNSLNPFGDGDSAKKIMSILEQDSFH